MSACVALLACVTLGCEGSMSFRDVEGGEEPGVADAGGGRGEDAGTDAGRGLEPAGAVEMPLKRLTPLQYHNAVRALFDGLLEPGFFDDADRGAAPSGPHECCPPSSRRSLLSLGTTALRSCIIIDAEM